MDYHVGILPSKEEARGLGLVVGQDFAGVVDSVSETESAAERERFSLSVCGCGCHRLKRKELNVCQVLAYLN